MHVERSKCGKCGFINYNWNPLPSCEHYLTINYDRIPMNSIEIPPWNAYLLVLDYKRKQTIARIVELNSMGERDTTTLIDTEFWNPNRQIITDNGRTRIFHKDGR